MLQEIEKCRSEVDYRMLLLEKDIKEDTTAMKKHIQVIQISLTKLVERNDFMPVKLIGFGLAGGVLMTVLGIVLSKVLSS